MTSLCIFGATSPISSFSMDFPPILDDLGGLGDFGDLGDTATATFSFENFGLADETGAGTSSNAGVTKAVGTSSGDSSRPSRISRGDPTGVQSVLPFPLLTLFIVPIFMRMHVYMRCDL